MIPAGAGFSNQVGLLYQVIQSRYWPSNPINLCWPNGIEFIHCGQGCKVGVGGSHLMGQER